MNDKNEVVLTGIEQLNEYLKERKDKKVIVSVVLELVRTDIGEGGEADG